MFATTHVLASIAISQRVTSVWPAVGIALVSHYFLDLIPHGDQPVGHWIKQGPHKTKRLGLILMLDLCGTLLMGTVLYLNGNLPPWHVLIPAAIASVLPDFVWIGSDLYEKVFPRQARHSKIFHVIDAILDKIEYIHHEIHTFFDGHVKRAWPGALFQMIMFSFLLYLILAGR